MPIYEYKCADCGQQMERLQRIDDPPPGPCEACGGELHREVSAPAFQFKGTGWYVTDYADRTGGPAAKDGDGKDDGGKDGEAKDSGSESPTTKGDGGAKKTQSTTSSDSEKTAKAKD